MDVTHSKWRKPKPQVKGGRGRSLQAARQKRKEIAERKRLSPVAAKPSSTPKSSKSQEKLSRFSGPASISDEEYLIVDVKCIRAIAQFFPCPDCHTKTLVLSLSQRLGFSVKLTIKCTNCEGKITETFSSQRVADKESSTPPFDVNRKMTTAFLDIGAGHSAMSRFCSTMAIKTMDEKSFYNHMHKINEETVMLKQKILEESRAAVRKAHESIDPSLKEQPVLDVTVSVDGSWHRRGHTSLYGFVSAIDVMTGLVLDFEILSKFCLMCSIASSQYEENSAEFLEWKEKHLANKECSINFEGFSGNMEAGGAVIIFKRSVEKVGMRYTTFLSDGDAKTLSQLNKEKPYGDNIVIEKEECINHVSKRMGTALRNLVQTSKATGKALGGRGEGTLKDATIKVLQGYYHKALVSNIPDIAKMKSAILATLYHCSSTNKKPNHSFCPKGENSWCFFNKRKARKERKKRDHDKMPIKLNVASFKALLPLYERLSSEELLNRCAKGQTQNANEALHSVIWKQCPKHIFVSKSRLEYGITNGVAKFNMGCAALQALKSSFHDKPVPEVSLAVAERQDRKRVAQSSHQEESATKKQRLQQKHGKKKGKGNLYAPGAGD